MTNARHIVYATLLSISFFVVKGGDISELVDRAADNERLAFPKADDHNFNTTGFRFSQQLLGSADRSRHINRIGLGGRPCSEHDIVVDQGPTPPLPNGIPTYTVTVMNACVACSSISNIHLSCKWFSSARLIDPNIFRRLYYDDCLVNGGKPLPAGESLSFAYANTFPYPLLVSSVDCL